MKSILFRNQHVDCITLASPRKLNAFGIDLDTILSALRLPNGIPPLCFALCLAAAGYALPARAETPAFRAEVLSVSNGAPIPDTFAFCVPDGAGKHKNGGNINPEIRWSGAPAGTQSFAVVMVDGDVPATFDDANRDGKTIAADLPRQNFYHWLVVDIPATRTHIAEGEDSKAHSASGKPIGRTAYGTVGQNDFASFMKGTFGGYDGPCPPWNDALLHRYRFQVYALDVATPGLSGAFNGKQALAAIKPHMLAMAETVGTFTNNAALIK